MIHHPRAPLELAVLLLALAACAAPPPAPEVQGTSIPLPEGLLSRLAAAERDVRAVRGLARVAIGAPGARRTITEAVLLAPPDRLRLETLTFGGTTALVLASDGLELFVHSPGAGRYLRGRATPQNLAAVAGFRLQLAHLVRILSGLPPLPVRPQDPRLLARAVDGEVVLESGDGPFTQRLRAAGPHGPLRGGELWEAGRPSLQFGFEDWRAARGPGAASGAGSGAGDSPLLMPWRIALRQPEEGLEVQVAYQEVEVDGPGPADLFRLPPPTDGATRVIDLDGAPER